MERRLHDCTLSSAVETSITALSQFSRISRGAIASATICLLLYLQLSLYVAAATTCAEYLRILLAKINCDFRFRFEAVQAVVLLIQQ